MLNREVSVRETLEEFYTELDCKWREAEGLLLSFRVPAPVSVRIKTVEPSIDEKPFLTTCHHDLGYVKHYGKWGVAYGLSGDGNPGSLYWMSIHHCSAEQQVEAAKVFPQLMEAVVNAAENYGETVLEAVGILEGLLKRTDPQQSGPQETDASAKSNQSAAKPATETPASPVSASAQPVQTGTETNSSSLNSQSGKSQETKNSAESTAAKPDDTSTEKKAA